MKYLILALIPAAVLWHGCQPGNAGSAEIPESPEARLALLKEKRVQLGQLEKEIAELETLVGEAALAGREEKPKLVTSLVVQPVTFRRYSEIQGNVSPVRMNAISSETGGRLTKVLVRTGDEVKAGQLLATVDMEPLQKQLQEVEAAWQLAKDVHDRQKRLWDQQIGSEIQYLQAKNNLERLDKSMESLRSQIRKGSIMAPISGVIEELHYEQGDVAPPGMPIMQLINTRDLKIVAEVPERFVGTVREGDKVRIRIPVLNTEQEARILTVGRMIHPSNRTFRLETTLDNRKGIFKPNLLALVDIEDYKEPNALVVPVDIVQQEVGGKHFVYVKGDEAPNGFLARKVYVGLGESHDNAIVIREGLKAGDEIIVRGARSLSDNDLLDIQPESHE